MFCNHHHKVVFIHIPKTGGTSIRRFFVDDVPHTVWAGIHEEKDIVNGHMGAEELWRIYDFSAYHSFAIVRNPYDVMVSHFEFTKAKYAYQGKFIDFVHLATQKGAVRMPYFYYIASKGKILVKNLLRFEDFNNEVNGFLVKVGINAHFDLHLNQTKRGEYKGYYNDRSYKMVTDYFKQDINYFNYQF